MPITFRLITQPQFGLAVSPTANSTELSTFITALQSNLSAEESSLIPPVTRDSLNRPISVILPLSLIQAIGKKPFKSHELPYDLTEAGKISYFFDKCLSILFQTSSDNSLRLEHISNLLMLGELRQICQQATPENVTITDQTITAKITLTGKLKKLTSSEKQKLLECLTCSSFKASISDDNNIVSLQFTINTENVTIKTLKTLYTELTNLGFSKDIASQAVKKFLPNVKKVFTYSEALSSKVVIQIDGYLQPIDFLTDYTEIKNLLDDKEKKQLEQAALPCFEAYAKACVMQFQPMFSYIDYHMAGTSLLKYIHSFLTAKAYSNLSDIERCTLINAYAEQTLLSEKSIIFPIAYMIDIDENFRFIVNDFDKLRKSLIKIQDIEIELRKSGITEENIQRILESAIDILFKDYQANINKFSLDQFIELFNSLSLSLAENEQKDDPSKSILTQKITREYLSRGTANSILGDVISRESQLDITALHDTLQKAKNIGFDEKTFIRDVIRLSVQKFFILLLKNQQLTSLEDIMRKKATIKETLKDLVSDEQQLLSSQIDIAVRGFTKYVLIAPIYGDEESKKLSDILDKHAAQQGIAVNPLTMTGQESIYRMLENAHKICTGFDEQSLFQSDSLLVEYFLPHLRFTTSPEQELAIDENMDTGAGVSPPAKPAPAAIDLGQLIAFAQEDQRATSDSQDDDSQVSEKETIFFGKLRSLSYELYESIQRQMRDFLTASEYSCSRKDLDIAALTAAMQYLMTKKNTFVTNAFRSIPALFKKILTAILSTQDEVITDITAAAAFCQKLAALRKTLQGQKIKETSLYSEHDINEGLTAVFTRNFLVKDRKTMTPKDLLELYQKFSQLGISETALKEKFRVLAHDYCQRIFEFSNIKAKLYEDLNNPNSIKLNLSTVNIYNMISFFEEKDILLHIGLSKEEFENYLKIGIKKTAAQDFDEESQEFYSLIARDQIISTDKTADEIKENAEKATRLMMAVKQEAQSESMPHSLEELMSACKDSSDNLQETLVVKFIKPCLEKCPLEKTAAAQQDDLNKFISLGFFSLANKFSSLHFLKEIDARIQVYASQNNDPKNLEHISTTILTTDSYASHSPRDLLLQIKSTIDKALKGFFHPGRSKLTTKFYEKLQSDLNNHLQANPVGSYTNTAGSTAQLVTRLDPQALPVAAATAAQIQDKKP